jgi:hypothetical protein
LFAPRPQAVSSTPHPAVARIIVPERDGVAFGSGTLVDVEGDQGLVVTNWHVVRDAAGEIIVTFPDGFSSKAKVLRTDETWDLAALVIWKPVVAPATLASGAPAPGDPLTIAGYGSGDFRAVTARCTQYVSPGTRFPPEMVEVAAQARQGDSGGPILNGRGELAGVLFGAAQGTTSGSYVGRVRSFLSPLSPRLADPNYVAAPSATAVASSNPFAGGDGQLLSQPAVPQVPAASIATQNTPANVSVPNVPVASEPLVAIAESKGDVEARAGESAEGSETARVETPAKVASVPKPAPRAAHVTFGALPPDDEAGIPMLADDPAYSQATQPLWSRPLPKDLLPPPGAVEPVGTASAGENRLWEAIFGKTPLEQGKSLLAAFALAGIVSRLLRTE